ncbi:MAG: hypothetical protein IT364_20180 [Candidatus Hydrogenedentes bacterium]|nr:hypothetical protein [Candidatus Hydrogenedentota bacterium]
MAQEDRIRRFLWFFAKVLVATPLCLAIWWLALPYYARCIGAVAGVVLRAGFGFPIDSVTVEPSGILNTGTTLGFTLRGQNPALPIAQLVSNIATYAALVLATSGVTWKRLLVIGAAGAGVLAVGHVVYLVLVFAYSSAMAENPVLPTAIAQAFITLPFVLWIALAYWSQADWMKGLKDAQDSPAKAP